MKIPLILTLLLSLLLLPTMLWAAPAPDTYNDPVWYDLIENNTGNAFPQSEPLGPGAVSGCYGDDYWPSGYLQIYRPLDLRNLSGLEFSPLAISNHKFYASESMRIFLEASLATMRQLDPKNEAVIPILSLFYDQTDSIPMQRMSEDTVAIQLGVFIREHQKSKPLAFAYITDGGIQKGTTKQTQAAAKAYERYKKYSEDMRPYLSEFKSLNTGQLNKRITEITKALRAEAKNAPKTPKDKGKNASKDIRNNDKNKDAKLKKIENKYQKSLNDIQMHLAATSGDDRKNKADLYIQIEQQMYADIEAYKLEKNPDLAAFFKAEHEHYDAIDKKIREATYQALLCESDCEKAYDKVDALEAERSQLHESRRSVLRENAKLAGADKNLAARCIQFNEENRRMHAERAAQNRDTMRMTRAQNGLSERNETLDLARTWTMFEAMLTQDAVPIADILMPMTLKLKLVEYAVKAHRPQEIIDRFSALSLLSYADTPAADDDETPEEPAKPSTSGKKKHMPPLDGMKNTGIIVHLMCSARDRFLGCQIGGDPYIEAKVSNAASLLLKLSEQSSRSDQFRAIAYVVRANPVDLTYKLDTKSLKESIRSMIGNDRKIRYNKLLSDYAKIPMRGDTSPKETRASKLRKKSQNNDDTNIDI